MSKYTYKNIDEQIFTEIAPEIEDAILSKYCNEKIIERVFNVPFIKEGTKNKTYTVKKYMLVVIREI